MAIIKGIMLLDINSEVVKLCAEGMILEGAGEPEAAKEHYLNAWESATNDREKFIAAHYIARQQKNVVDKLQWDNAALNACLKINDESVWDAYPSLYLNLAKDYEDMGDFGRAQEVYHLAQSFTKYLSEDGYGKMITGGIINGLERTRR
ncbi:MAG TPA: rRNA adenine methyltransferase [Chryseolinea sp.]|nr:rRNA adenine methyltransferase [Chryseolinea sp.]